MKAMTLGAGWNAHRDEGVLAFFLFLVGRHIKEKILMLSKWHICINTHGNGQNIEKCYSTC
jgi:hypothetical protein